MTYDNVSSGTLNPTIPNYLRATNHLAIVVLSYSPL